MRIISDRRSSPISSVLPLFLAEKENARTDSEPDDSEEKRLNRSDDSVKKKKRVDKRSAIRPFRFVMPFEQIRELTPKKTTPSAEAASSPVVSKRSAGSSETSRPREETKFFRSERMNTDVSTKISIDEKNTANFRGNAALEVQGQGRL